LGEIKRHDGGIQVIMLTGLVTMSAALRSFRLGAEACLFKPMDDFAPLVEAVHRTYHKIDGWRQTLEQLSGNRPDDSRLYLGPSAQDAVGDALSVARTHV
jgi:DNA-binding NtrC family response regulator